MRSPEQLFAPSDDGAILFDLRSTGNTPVSGTAFDTSSYSHVLIFIITSSTVGSGTLRIVVQNSDTGTNPWPDIAPAVLTIPDATTQDIHGPIVLRTEGTRRYLRLRADNIVSASTVNFGAYIVGFNAANDADNGSAALVL